MFYSGARSRKASLLLAPQHHLSQPCPALRLNRSHSRSRCRSTMSPIFSSDAMRRRSPNLRNTWGHRAGRCNAIGLQGEDGQPGGSGACRKKHEGGMQTTGGQAGVAMTPAFLSCSNESQPSPAHGSYLVSRREQDEVGAWPLRYACMGEVQGTVDKPKCHSASQYAQSRAKSLSSQSQSHAGTVHTQHCRLPSPPHR